MNNAPKTRQYNRAFSDEQVRTIRREYAIAKTKAGCPGPTSYATALVSRYGSNKDTIYRILSGTVYGDVSEAGPAAELGAVGWLPVIDWRAAPPDSSEKPALDVVPNVFGKPIPTMGVAMLHHRAAGHTVVDSHMLPCGSVVYRMSNFDILRSDPKGVSEGRLDTNCWEAAKAGRRG